jgi:hypothetical protein
MRKGNLLSALVLMGGERLATEFLITRNEVESIYPIFTVANDFTHRVQKTPMRISRAASIKRQARKANNIRKRSAKRRRNRP